MYIMRERLKISTRPCKNDSLEAKVERLKSRSPPRDMPILPITPVSPPRQQNWIPRNLQESQLLDDGMAKTLLYKSAFSSPGAQVKNFNTKGKSESSFY